MQVGYWKPHHICFSVVWLFIGIITNLFSHVMFDVHFYFWGEFVSIFAFELELMRRCYETKEATEAFYAYSEREP